jgi:hypothetical protein
MPSGCSRFITTRGRDSASTKPLPCSRASSSLKCRQRLPTVESFAAALEAFGSTARHVELLSEMSAENHALSSFSCCAAYVAAFPLEELREAWPRTDDGFAAFCQLVRPSAVAVRDHRLPDR